ncbi:MULTISPECIES: hypothetical protein [Cyanophyceae]|uniref:hypothetical protein n=1 Tax=Cyanophyceae TaxID=3028117 RepID=UPI0012EA6093|nr:MULTISPECIES: hypothetical protein [Cyanophyceae]
MRDKNDLRRSPTTIISFSLGFYIGFCGKRRGTLGIMAVVPGGDRQRTSHNER